MKTIFSSALAAFLTAVFLLTRLSASEMPSTDMHLYPPTTIEWKAGPPSLPPGAKMAVLEGDPTKEGPFTMRVMLPDGFSIPPHIHPATEHITVISGTFNFGMGDKFDKSATQAMPAGTFGHWPGGMK